MLQRWRHRPPDALDFDMNYQNFSESSWQFVLYGMEYRTDLSANAAAFSQHDTARARFREIDAQIDRALRQLPSHRALIDLVHGRAAMPSQVRA